MKNKAIVPRWAVLCYLSLSPLGAQLSTRSIQGEVMDQYSRPLEHAVVQIQNDSTLMIRSYITQADGRYHFTGLNDDVYYELTAEYDGLRGRERALSKFDSHEKRTMDLRIRLGN